jgi:hypothetical protein
VQVERDFAVAGRDPVSGLVLEHVDEFLVSDRARIDDEVLHAGAPEQEGDALRRRLLERAGER